MTRLIKILFEKVVEVLENEYEETKKQAGNCCLEAQVGNPRGFELLTSWWNPRILTTQPNPLGLSKFFFTLIKSIAYVECSMSPPHIWKLLHFSRICCTQLTFITMLQLSNKKQFSDYEKQHWPCKTKSQLGYIRHS